MSNDKKEVRRNESKLSYHKQFKKELKPPLLQINLTPSSWVDKRLPEMLWAVLVIGNIERKIALNFLGILQILYLKIKIVMM
ncbi:MAG TPA: hypothetical protein PK455_06630 [Caldisericia bacterium]|nr:hypothetical protein [Caldisericia bacterium]